MNKDLIKQKTEHINDILKEYLPENTNCGRICEAMGYSVLNGGKRLRAIMLLEAFRMFCVDEIQEKKFAEPFACALEFIHAYSLVHDDLPAMDNDVLRRGKPTTHVKFGHAMGVLTGDALLNLAYETISAVETDALSDDGDAAKRVLKALHTLGEKAGFSGMVGGQVLDTTEKYDPKITAKGFNEIDSLELSNFDTNKLKYTLHIYELKTSELFEAALMCGAILGGAAEKEILAMERAGRALGLAFQIEDDILDITSDASVLGKSTNIDEKNGKDTAARILGVDQAVMLVKFYTDTAIDAILNTDRDTGFLEDLFESLVMRKL